MMYENLMIIFRKIFDTAKYTTFIPISSVLEGNSTPNQHQPP
jgi:hypothetical protein